MGVSSAAIAWILGASGYDGSLAVRSDATVSVMVNTFDGAALIRAVLPQPELEDGRIQLLATMLGSLGVQT